MAQIEVTPHNRLRTFNKHVANRITRHFARWSRGPFAVIRHVGRRSGTPYETTIMVKPAAGAFVIALTYGESVDWYRNVRAAGHATLLWHGREYALGKPEPLAVQRAWPLYSPLQRLILRMIGTQQFVRVTY
jgi:deazaflavin-dependent oxidoreductase (nitroreductase family)